MFFKEFFTYDMLIISISIITYIAWHIHLYHQVTLWRKVLILISEGANLRRNYQCACAVIRSLSPMVDAIHSWPVVLCQRPGSFCAESSFFLAWSSFEQRSLSRDIVSIFVERFSCLDLFLLTSEEYFCFHFYTSSSSALSISPTSHIPYNSI